jgi:hypothetical protein
VGAAAGHLPAPAQRLLLHLALRAPGAAGPERVPDVHHRPFHARLVPRFLPASGVHEGAEVGRQLRIPAVDARVVQVGAVDAGVEVVDDQAGRDPLIEGEGGDVRGAPGPGVQREHRTQEQVPGPGEHHQEAPHPARVARERVGPATEIPVVDLGLLAGLPGWSRHPHPIPRRLVGELRPAVAAEARQAHRQPVLVAQTLVDGGDGVGLEHRLDQRAVGRDQGMGEAAGPGVDQLREPAADECRPLHPRQRWPTGRHPGRLRRSHVLAHGLRVKPQALRDDQLGPARVPVLEHLHDIDHVERSPRHRDLAASSTTREILVRSDEGALSTRE